MVKDQRTLEGALRKAGGGSLNSEGTEDARPRPFTHPHINDEKFKGGQTGQWRPHWTNGNDGKFDWSHMGNDHKSNGSHTSDDGKFNQNHMGNDEKSNGGRLSNDEKLTLIFAETLAKFADALINDV
eukprot:953528-Amphidinium_carterae.1